MKARSWFVIGWMRRLRFECLTYSISVGTFGIWLALCIDLELVGLLCMLVKVMSVVKVGPIDQLWVLEDAVVNNAHKESIN